jgi:HSP20 family protein
MFGTSRWNPFDELLNFQREADRLFNQFWRDLPARSAESWSSPSLQVKAGDDGWRIEVPMPGIDPRHISLEVAGSALCIRADQPGDTSEGQSPRYEQTLNVPRFLDLERITASHRFGMLELHLPLKEEVKPRRIQIATEAGDAKQLTAA